MSDPRPYWNDPETRDIALKLIADTGDAVVAMKAAGADTEAVLDTLGGTIAYLIARHLDPSEDEENVSQFAWALVGKILAARRGLPIILATKPGTA